MKKTSLLFVIGIIFLSVQSCQKENLQEDSFIAPSSVNDTRGSSDDYVADEIIIRYNEDYTEEEKIVLRQKYSTEVGFELNYFETSAWDNKLELWKVSKEDGSSDVNVNDLITSMSTKEFDEGDLEEHVNAILAHSFSGDYNSSSSTEVEEYLTQGTDGPIIAIIDSGVDYGAISGEFLLPPVNSLNPDEVSGWDFVNNDNNVVDDFGHGTHIVKIIKTELEANNAKARFISLKAFNENGSGRLFDLLRALAYVNANENIGIVSMSLGLKGAAKNYNILEELINEVAENTLIICSSGNEGTNVDVEAHLPSGFSNTNIISVGGYSKELDNITINNGIVSGIGLATMSNYGKTTVDIAAPFDDYKVKYPNNPIIYNLEGTSFSAAFVTAKAAILLNTEPNLAIVKKELYSSSYKSFALSGKIGKGNVFLMNEE